MRPVRRRRERVGRELVAGSVLLLDSVAEIVSPSLRAVKDGRHRSDRGRRNCLAWRFRWTPPEVDGRRRGCGGTDQLLPPHRVQHYRRYGRRCARVPARRRSTAGVDGRTPTAARPPRSATTSRRAAARAPLHARRTAWMSSRAGTMSLLTRRTSAARRRTSTHPRSSKLGAGRGTVGKTVVAGVKDRETSRISAAVVADHGSAANFSASSQSGSHAGGGIPRGYRKGPRE